MKQHNVRPLKNPDLSIIIVNYNAKKFLDACLSSLYNTIKQYTYEVIVIDNASCDDSVQFLNKKHPKVKILVNIENIGYAKANNQGIKISRGNFILLLNPDTLVSESSINNMMHYLMKFSDSGIVGPKVMNPGNKLQWDSCGSYLTPLTLFLKESGLEKLFPHNKLLGKRLLRYWDRNSSRNVDWVSGVCLLIKKEILDDIGLLDERFFAYMEDMDICRRANEKKWRVVYLHDTKITHEASSSWQNATKQQLFISIVSEKKYLKKYYGIFGVILFEIAHLIGSSIRLYLHFLLNNYNKAKHHFYILVWLMQSEI
jgi:GT2 family glycosyltransferase